MLDRWEPHHRQCSDPPRASMAAEWECWNRSARHRGDGQRGDVRQHGNVGIVNVVGNFESSGPLSTSGVSSNLRNVGNGGNVGNVRLRLKQRCCHRRLQLQRRPRRLAAWPEPEFRWVRLRSAILASAPHRRCRRQPFRPLWVRWDRPRCHRPSRRFSSVHSHRRATAPTSAMTTRILPTTITPGGF